MKNLSREATEVTQSYIDQFSTIHEMLECYDGFGICFDCGEIHEEYDSACCDNCGEFSVFGIDEAVAEIGNGTTD